MNGEWVRNGCADGSVLVFIHGLNSSPESCWRHSDGTYWPDVVARDKALSDVDIYVFTYMTGVFSGSYRLGDAVDALKEHMRLDGVDKRKRIVFVCHSLGGVLARRYLVQRAADLAEKDIEIGLFLLASPSLGSEFVNWLAPVVKSLGYMQAEAVQFTEGNSWLMDLDIDFTNLKERKRLRLTGKELVEDRFVLLRKIIRKKIVPTFSGAKYFGDPYKVPGSDHFSIAKIEGEEAVQHRLLREFIMEGAGGASRNHDASAEGEPVPGPQGVSMNCFAADDEDNINMRVVSRADDRVILEELTYWFDKDAVECPERVCLKALEVEWNWAESHRVTLDEPWRSPGTRQITVSADNPGVRIDRARHDAARFSLQLSSRAPQTALSPAEDEAVATLVLPGATILPARGERHRFSVKARKQHLCLARKDPADGSYRLVEPGNETLATQLDTLKRAIATALVEVAQGFPEDGRPLLLGVREAEALPRLPNATAAASRGGAA